MSAGTIAARVTFLLVLLIQMSRVQATPGLVLLGERTTGLGCVPEGRTVSYDCTVSNDGLGGGCDTTCIIAVAVVVFGAILVMLIVCVIIALCLCHFRKRDSKSEGSKGSSSQEREKESPPVGSQGSELKEPPSAHLATYAEPDDVISNPQLPPRKYEGAEESTSKGTELNYATISVSTAAAKGETNQLVEVEKLSSDLGLKWPQMGN